MPSSQAELQARLDVLAEAGDQTALVAAIVGLVALGSKCCCCHCKCDEPVKPPPIDPPPDGEGPEAPVLLSAQAGHTE